MKHPAVVYIVSSACHGAGNCIAAGLLPSGDVSLRDTKTWQEQVFTPAEWDTFLTGVRAGEFDRIALRSANPEHRCRNGSCSKWGQAVSLMRSVFPTPVCEACGCAVSTDD